MFISSLELRNVLSFHEPPPFELRPLNILIGPNGSGKSNLIDCFGFLQSLPNSLGSYVNRSGGADSWIWKGPGSHNIVRVKCRFNLDESELSYTIEFGSLEHALRIDRELLCAASRTDSFLARQGSELRIGEAPVDIVSINPAESVFSAYRNPLDPTPVTRAGRALSDIRIYRGFDTSINSSTRSGVSSSAEKHPLWNNGGNLALVLQEMEFLGALRQVKGYLSRLSERFEDIKFRAEGGYLQLYVEERTLDKIPATRLSDGTLNFLCLMAVLLDPAPPRLLCIEEPESGLHPDALSLVADALKEASSRMQVVVTTHSDALVDRFTDESESIVVCERDNTESTQLRRLSRPALEEWLSEYSLGDLWRRGELGGTQR
jgi:predicted ATPase